MTARPLARLAAPGRPAVDVTNEKVGTFTIVEPTSRIHPGDRTKIWLLVCSCGEPMFMSVARIRRYQAAGCRPRCNCDDYKRGIKKRSEFVIKTVANGRLPGRYDCYCAGLPWRVPRGKRCSCGLNYSPEEPVQLVTDSLQSSAALALEHAPGAL